MPEVGRSSTSPANVQRLPYYPGPDHTWERPQPEAVGIDSYLLQEAIAFANDPAHAGYPPDLGTHLPAIHGGRRYDDGVILGPTKARGSVSGVVLRHGYLVAEWGEPERVDMTFSITKSFLSTVAGLAWDRGLIPLWCARTDLAGVTEGFPIPPMHLRRAGVGEFESSLPL